MDWPEGIEQLVEPVPPAEKIGLDESDWQDGADAIADWIAWVDTFEPLKLTDAERAEMERYRAEHRRFNIEAVRKQMQLRENPDPLHPVGVSAPQPNPSESRRPIARSLQYGMRATPRYAR